MILRFIVENVASFKEAVEFNTFPSSKSQSHGNHKMACGHVTALRMSAIYLFMVLMERERVIFFLL